MKIIWQFAGMKRCSVCKEYKNLNDFGNACSEKMGKFCQCKQCRKEANGNRYREAQKTKGASRRRIGRDPEKLKEKCRRYRKIHREACRRYSRVNKEKIREKDQRNISDLKDYYIRSALVSMGIPREIINNDLIEMKRDQLTTRRVYLRANSFLKEASS